MLVSCFGTDVLVQGKLNLSIRKCHGPDPKPSAISHQSSSSQAGATLRLKGIFLPSLITKKRWKLNPSPTSSQHLLSEEKHPFLDSPRLRRSRRGFLNLEKMAGPFFALVLSVPNHSSLLRVSQALQGAQANPRAKARRI